MTELIDWLAHRLSSGDSEVTPSTNRVTVRIDLDLHQKLVHLASAVGMSKTATAEGILSAAIKDAWTAYVATLDPDELEDLRNDMHTEVEYEFSQIAGS